MALCSLQHHDPHVLVNYAAVAREEMHEVGGWVVLSGLPTGVLDW